METVEHQIVTLSGDEARKENQRSKFGAKLDRCKKMIDPDLDPASQSYTICIVAILEPLLKNGMAVRADVLKKLEAIDDADRITVSFWNAWDDVRIDCQGRLS